MIQMPENKLPPEIQKLIDEHPQIFIMGTILIGAMLCSPQKPRAAVPELGGRRNNAWRGPGSFGHAPFGSQVSHRR